MKKQELINLIMMVLGREKHFSLIKSHHATEEMATDIVKMLEEKAESVEHLFNFDKESEDQILAVPLKWLKSEGA